MHDNVIASLELESITPLWPGGPLEGHTYRCRGAYNCIGPFLPDSKQLIGRLRWMLRAIEASIALLRGKHPRSLEEVEGLASRVFGSTNSASKLVVSVEFTYDRQAIDYMDARRVERSLPPHFLETAEIMGHIILRRRLGLPDHTRLPKKAGRYFEGNRKWLESSMPALKDLYRLLTIPRVRLALQVKRLSPADIYSRLPLRPAIGLKIQLRRRLGALLSKAEIGLIEVLIPYTLLFMGLGKATSRGFGRFKLKELEGGSESPHVEECVEKLKAIGPDSLYDAFKDCGCRLLELAAEAIGHENMECDEDLLYEYKLELEEVGREHELGVGGAVDKVQGLGVPALLVAMANSAHIGDLKHPCPYALPELSVENQRLPGCLEGKKRVADIVDALSAVGKATLKSTWKYLHGRLRKAGLNYHTWALGLPRSVDGTGYFLAANAFGEKCGYDLKELLGGQPPTPRRLSPLVVTTTCSEEGCSALLEPFVTAVDFRERLSRLVHVGKYPGNLYRAASVRYILGKPRLGKAFLCPNVTGGIAVVGEYSAAFGTYTASTDAELAAQLVALEWIRYLLS